MPCLHDLPAPAKLNLFLHVTGRRPDGYHLLESVFVLIDWQDTLHIETRADGQLRRHDLGPRLPEDDLCLRAARLLQQLSGTSMGCDIHIDKQVPWGAGLGGGSSDAATVLLALNQLWQLNWPEDRLAALAVTLGADVPFFVHGRNAWVEGIGERITPIALPESVLSARLLVLKPPVAVPTPAIFGSPALKRDTAHATIADFLAAPQRFGRNDLQIPAVAWRPPSGGTQADFGGESGSSPSIAGGRQIEQALDAMQARHGNSRMTGSGSAVFSWIASGNAGGPEAVIEACQRQVGGEGWVGRVCRVLPQHPLLDRLEFTSAA